MAAFAACCARFVRRRGHSPKLKSAPKVASCLWRDVSKVRGIQIINVFAVAVLAGRPQRVADQFKGTKNLGDPRFTSSEGRFS